jgi:hypothetical protein
MYSSRQLATVPGGMVARIGSFNKSFNDLPRLRIARIRRQLGLGKTDFGW